MSWITSRLTNGLVTASSPYPFGPNAFSICSRLPSKGFPDLDTSSYDLNASAHFADNVGRLSLKQLPDGSGIEITVIADFPDTYQGMYAVLRGQFEYKRNTTSPNAIAIYVQNTPVPTDITIVDTDLTPGIHYYYSVVALVGGDGVCDIWSIELI